MAQVFQDRVMVTLNLMDSPLAQKSTERRERKGKEM
ncbi:hypothetical protein NC651_019437 [Populus alba x Populus x berolinensis]|nr:hypothetical protein NC651_019437 [Populus alba x Populus x berolinensis]